MGIFSTHNMKRNIFILALVLAGGIVFAIGMIRLNAQSQSLRNEIIVEIFPPEEPQPSRAELSMKALAAAYPWSIERAEFRDANSVGDANEGGEGGDGDWAVLLRDTWYYYAGGRMLPEELLDRASEYSTSFVSYNYQRELPPWTEPSADQVDRYRNRNNNNNSSNNESTPRPQLRRSLAFQEALWQASSRNEASRQIKSINFLGYTVPVHSDIVEILSRVEEHVITIAKTDPQVQSWITNIGEMHGWNWRNVAGSASRSNHSYGIAIDILPKSLGGKATYWQWTANWWSVPYEGRYHPPEAVIKTFESYGFIWGGKWTYYDTMHFEFRPEIFILSGMELEYLR
jgi:hypothetical protein